MFDLRSVVEDYLPEGSPDAPIITQHIYNLVEQYSDVLGMLYIVDIQDPTREEKEMSFYIQQSIHELQFHLFQLFNQNRVMPIFDIQHHHLSIYIPLIHYMSKLNKLQLDMVHSSMNHSYI